MPHPWSLNHSQCLVAAVPMPPLYVAEMGDDLEAGAGPTLISSVGNHSANAAGGGEAGSGGGADSAAEAMEGRGDSPWGPSWGLKDSEEAA